MDRYEIAFWVSGFFAFDALYHLSAAILGVPVIFPTLNVTIGPDLHILAFVATAIISGIFLAYGHQSKKGIGARHKRRRR